MSRRPRNGHRSGADGCSSSLDIERFTRCSIQPSPRILRLGDILSLPSYDRPGAIVVARRCLVSSCPFWLGVILLVVVAGGPWRCKTSACAGLDWRIQSTAHPTSPPTSSTTGSVTLSTSRPTPRSRRACPTSVSDGDSGPGIGFSTSPCLAPLRLLASPHCQNGHPHFTFEFHFQSVPFLSVARTVSSYTMCFRLLSFISDSWFSPLPLPRRADHSQSTTARPASSTTSPPVPSV